MIPATTREALDRAMEQFDTQFRGSEEWQDWEANGNYKFAIQQNGRLYPVKTIVSIATGAPTKTFSGGREANDFARRYGLTIVPLAREGTLDPAVLECYLAKFGALNSQKSTDFWPAAALHR